MATISYTLEEPVSEPTVEKYFGLKRMPALQGKETLDKHVAELKLPTDYSFNDPKCLVGIEVEVERITRIDPNTTLLLWQIREDGSLRNNGREFVSWPMPAFYSYPALQLLFNGLNADHDFSKRTSIHVHINVRNLTAQQVLATLLIYHSVEPLLFDYVGGNRTNNIFCVPWTNSDFLSHKLGGPDKWKTLAELRGLSEKYSALNIIPLETFGTLEFRHMPGTSDVQKIIRWIDMITAMRLYAVRNGFDKVLSEIVNLNTNSQYEKYLESVFGPTLKPLFNTSNIYNVMERNVVDIKGSLLNAVFHNKKINYTPDALVKSAMAKFMHKLMGGKEIPVKKPKKGAKLGDFLNFNPALDRVPVAAEREARWRVDPVREARLERVQVRGARAPDPNRQAAQFEDLAPGEVPQPGGLPPAVAVLDENWEGNVGLDPFPEEVVVEVDNPPAAWPPAAGGLGFAQVAQEAAAIAGVNEQEVDREALMQRWEREFERERLVNRWPGGVRGGGGGGGAGDIAGGGGLGGDQ